MTTYQVIFPLTGIIPEIIFGLQIIIIFITIEIFFYFLYRYHNSKDKEKNSRNSAWSILFLGYGITYIFYTIADYFIDSSGNREFYSQLGYIALATGALVYFIMSEKIEESKKFPFSILCSIILIITIVTFIIGRRDIAQSTAIFATPFAAIFVLRYFIRLAIISKFNRAVLSKILGVLISLLIIIIGYVFIAEYFLNLMGIEIRVISAIFNIIGLNLFLITMQKLPDYREFEWINSLNAIFIIEKSGLTIFSRFYNSKDNDIDGKDLLIGGAISSTKTILSSLTSSEDLNFVNLEDKVLIFKRDENVGTACIIADQYLKSLDRRLEDFMNKFKQMFDPIMDSWNGNIDLFIPAESLCNKIFRPI